MLKNYPKLKEALEWAYCIIIAVVLALLFRYYIGTPTIVMQPSMEPTLYEGQRLFLSRWNRTINKMPERGDIVTFEQPTELYITALDADLDNPVAQYDYEPSSIWGKFKYYVLEMGKQSYIKRVIGLPGDHVKIEDGYVYINGELLDEYYLNSDVVTTSLDGVYTDIVVPEGYVYVLGDNRSHSTDSRRFGCIPLEKIESKVMFRFWPLNLFGKVK